MALRHALALSLLTFLAACTAARAQNNGEITDPNPRREFISFAPNPTLGTIVVRFEAEYDTLLSIEIFNLLGERMLGLNERILQSTRLRYDFYKRELDLGLLPAGLYLARVRSGNRTWTKQVMKL